MAGETVLILGGGIGGLTAAFELRKRLPRDRRVVVVDKTGEHLFQPSLLWVMSGARRPEGIVRDLGALERRGIELVRGTVEAIDVERRAVRVNGEEHQGDALIVALGAQLAPERVPGLTEAGPTFYTLEGARAISDARNRITEGRLAIVVAGMPFKCPAAPYEAALLLDHDARKRRVRDRVSISLYTPEGGPMAVAGPEVSASVRGMVEERGVAYHTQRQIAEVDSSARELVFADGTREGYDWLVHVPPHVCPGPVREAGLTNDAGWVPVDPHTLETSHPGVYAVGDVTTIPVATGAPLPKAGVFAEHEAKIVARNIADRLTGKGASHRYEGYGACFVEIGGGRAAYGSGNFYGDPAPQVRLRRPGRQWHFGKVYLERSWLNRIP